jgi:hypothetical protein
MPFPVPGLYVRSKAATADPRVLMPEVAMGTVSLALPVVGSVLNFSPIDETAPPDLGDVTAASCRAGVGKDVESGKEREIGVSLPSGKGFEAEVDFDVDVRDVREALEFVVGCRC